MPCLRALTRVRSHVLWENDQLSMWPERQGFLGGGGGGGVRVDGRGNSQGVAAGRSHRDPCSSPPLSPSPLPSPLGKRTISQHLKSPTRLDYGKSQRLKQVRRQIHEPSCGKSHKLLNR